MDTQKIFAVGDASGEVEGVGNWRSRVRDSNIVLGMRIDSRLMGQLEDPPVKVGPTNGSSAVLLMDYGPS